MESTVVLISFFGSIIFYVFTPWAKSISIGTYLDIVLLLWAASFCINMYIKVKYGVRLNFQLWVPFILIGLVMAIGVVVAELWPQSRWGGGILCVFGVTAWVTMIYKLST